MPTESQLQSFIDSVIQSPLDEDRDLLDQVDGKDLTAKDLTLAYLALGDGAAARRWATAAAPAYLESARFKADVKFNPSEPPEKLTTRPWTKALKAIELATFAGDQETTREAATLGREWVSLDLIEHYPSRKNILRIDLLAGLGAVVLEEPYEHHFETVRNHFEEMTNPHTRKRIDLALTSAIEGIANNDVDAVASACQEIDRYHSTFDRYQSIATERVNIHSCFCVSFGRERGLDLNYTSEFVPESMVEDYPLGI